MCLEKVIDSRVIISCSLSILYLNKLVKTPTYTPYHFIYSSMLKFFDIQKIECHSIPEFNPEIQYIIRKKYLKNVPEG